MQKEETEGIIAVLAPQIDVNDEDMEIVYWGVSNKEEIEKGELFCSFETAKTTQDIMAEHSGVVYLLAEEKQKIKVGEVIAYIGETVEAIEQHMLHKELQKKEAEKGREVRCTAKARALAEKYNINIEDVPRKGSIVKEKEVLLFVEKLKEEAPPGKPAELHEEALPEFLFDYIESAGELSLHKERVAKHLVSTQNNIIFTTSEIEVCIENANRFLDENKMDNFNINLFHLLISKVARMLEEYELLKSFYYGGKLFTYKDTNIAFTVINPDNDYHLYTPVIMHSSKLSLEEVALKCNEFTLNIFRNDISISQMIGGCFTLSMLTGLEIKRFTALQNQYQSAILAVGSPHEKLIMESDSSIHSRQFINLTLSYDHRVCDGYYSGLFLNDLKNIIETIDGLDE